jgi:RNA polymerase sigma factor (sigma-70 family)
MATKQTHDVSRTTGPRDEEEWTDGELLECFVSTHDPAAFAAIVHRHGPMVMGVCCRVLNNHHDAEDAFQAAFLVLVRKAHSVKPQERVANWLYGVAYQTAQHARAKAARKNRRERPLDEATEPAVGGHDPWSDLEPLLDGELRCLPQRYRTAIVSCDLEGKTRKEVAEQLRVPEGTLSGWLTRGRAMLAKRLARHGLAGSVTALALLSEKASAGVPAAVVSSIIDAATLIAAGQSAATVISGEVAALVEGVLKAMFMTRLKLVSLVLVLAILGLIGPFLFVEAQFRPKSEVPPDGPQVEGRSVAVALRVGKRYVFMPASGQAPISARGVVVLERPVNNWVKVDFGDDEVGWVNLAHVVAIVPPARAQRFHEKDKK